MTELRALNRAMFWRILRRLLGANRGRLFVMLLALGAGAAVTAALLNLQVDAKRRLTTEFSAFGPNILVAPRESGVNVGSPQTLDESLLERIPAEWYQRGIKVVPLLYLVAEAYQTGSNRHVSLVVAGKDGSNLALGGSAGTFKDDVNGIDVARQKPIEKHESLISCQVGTRVAGEMQLRPHETLILQTPAREQACNFTSISATGGPQDDQVIVAIGAAQDLAALPGRVGMIELTVSGTPQEITNYIASLRQFFPDADVHPIRQFTEGEAKIYNRISGLLTATVGIVLLLTALCVMAAMTNVAIERKMDVGLMKAIGGATQRVVRLFLAEAALLGLGGGLIGAALGILLSIGLGKAVFGVAARPRLIVYPVAVGLTILVAVISAFPLRRLAGIRPASVFRGEA